MVKPRSSLRTSKAGYAIARGPDSSCEAQRSWLPCRVGRGGGREGCRQAKRSPRPTKPRSKGFALAAVRAISGARGAGPLNKRSWHCQAARRVVDYYRL